MAGGPLRKHPVLLNSEHIPHGKEPWFAALCPKSGRYCAARENLAVLGAMGEFQALACACENDGVISDDASAPERCEADRAVRPFARVSVPAPDAVFRKRYAPPFRRCLAQKKRSARGRIHFVFVMHFENFYVEAFIRARAPLAPRARQASSRRGSYFRT